MKLIALNKRNRKMWKMGMRYAIEFDDTRQSRKEVMLLEKIGYSDIKVVMQPIKISDIPEKWKMRVGFESKEKLERAVSTIDKWL